MATQDLVVLGHRPGFVQQAEICNTRELAERALLPQTGWIPHGRWSVDGATRLTVGEFGAVWSQ